MLFINDQFVDEKEACIHAQDRGFLLGDGAFETLRAYHGKVFAFSDHWARLCRSLEYLQIILNLNEDKVKTIIGKLLIRNRLEDQDAAIRITVTRGVGPRGISLVKSSAPTILITAHLYDPSVMPPSFTATFSDITINEKSPLTRYKTLNYLPNIVAKQKANASGFDEAILLNTQGLVVSATTANIFMIKEQKLYTPRLENGALPGITRQRILTMAKESGISFFETDIEPSALMTADEVFICNSLLEIKSISLVHGEFQKNMAHQQALLLKTLFDDRTLNYNY